MKKFNDLVNCVQLEDYLNNPSIIRGQYLYHITKLSNVVKILCSGKLKASQIQNMNDEFEKVYASSCRDYFTCFMSGNENFGVWAMYGGVGKQLQPKAMNNKDCFVKLAVPLKYLKKLVAKDKNLSLRKVAYTSMKQQKRTVLQTGWCKNTKNLPIHKTKLEGYIKDTAWVYEKEVRLVSKNEYIDISSILKYCRIIPSMDCSKTKCMLIFNNIKKSCQLLEKPHFIENSYYGSIDLNY